MQIPFLDPTAQYRRHQPAIDAALARVLASGRYTLGRECATFEAEFAEFNGDGHAIGVSSGHDALLLALRALEIGPGDEVITVAHTAVDTVAAIVHSGARPVLIDVERRSGTLDPRHLDDALSDRTRAIVPVHLYGHPANMLPILTFARQHELHVVEDCTQAPGARYQGQTVGTMGECSIFSLHPHSGLGGFGDGGVVLCSDITLAMRIRQLRQADPESPASDQPLAYGSRLDEVEAALLRIILEDFREEIERRRHLASIYQELLRDVTFPLLTPVPQPGCRHNYFRYVVQTIHRDALQRHLKTQGIATTVHYRIPVHLQTAFAFLGYKQGSLPVTEQLADLVLSLPMYPSLSVESVDFIARYIRQFQPTPT